MTKCAIDFYNDHLSFPFDCPLSFCFAVVFGKSKGNLQALGVASHPGLSNQHRCLHGELQLYHLMFQMNKALS